MGNTRDFFATTKKHKTSMVARMEPRCLSRCNSNAPCQNTAHAVYNTCLYIYIYMYSGISILAYCRLPMKSILPLFGCVICYLGGQVATVPRRGVALDLSGEATGIAEAALSGKAWCLGAVRASHASESGLMIANSIMEPTITPPDSIP